MRNVIKIMCGSCDQAANLHPVVDDGSGFATPCNREAENIGQSVWYNDVLINFVDRTYFKSDGTYLEAVGQYDFGQSFKKAEPTGVIAKEYGDYVTYDGDSMIAYDHSGSPAQSGSDLIKERIADDYGLFGVGADEAEYISPLDARSEQAKVDRWSDTDPNICTVTLEQHQTGIASEGIITQQSANVKVTLDDGTVEFQGVKAQVIKPNVENVIDAKLRNAYVEGNEGFTSRKLLDEELTKKYHQHLLNVFLDKQTGDVRIGSIRIIKNVDGTVTAQCVNRNCNPNGGKAARLTFDPNTWTREQMEETTWAIVAHGNNHAADWFRKRSTFHKVHAMGCEIAKCDPASVTCKVITHQDLLDDNEQLKFLKDHAVHCKNSECKHDERIMALTPLVSA